MATERRGKKEREIVNEFDVHMRGKWLILDAEWERLPVDLFEVRVLSPSVHQLCVKWCNCGLSPSELKLPLAIAITALRYYESALLCVCPWKSAVENYIFLTHEIRKAAALLRRQLPKTFPLKFNTYTFTQQGCGYPPVDSIYRWSSATHRAGMDLAVLDRCNFKAGLQVELHTQRKPEMWSSVECECYTSGAVRRDDRKSHSPPLLTSLAYPLPSISPPATRLPLASISCQNQHGKLVWPGVTLRVSPLPMC